VAKAQVAAARASVETIDAQMVVQQAQINAGQAQVDQAQAALVFAQQQAKRYRDLAATAIAGTVQDAQRKRGRKPRASQGSTRPGATESFLHDSYSRPARADCPA
jgi:multidrug resistance efflux pump